MVVRLVARRFQALAFPAADAEISLSMRYYQPRHVFNPSTHRFIFATGIECSYPTVEIDGQTRRIDQLEKAGHYKRWREDLELTRELGIRYLRYGPPYYRIHQGPGRFDWSFTDEVLPEMKRLNIVPIMDLCHFGVPDWIGGFQNPEFPQHFAEYARAFARRYPWVWCYTPINEMYITAEFSGYHGWWNERLKGHTNFVLSLKQICRATVLSMLAIIKERREALFILAESSEFVHTRDPALSARAEFFNERRFLSLDLICGRRVNAGLYSYLLDNRMTEDEFAFFLEQDLREHIIMGDDYYSSNEHVLVDEDRREDTAKSLGYYVLAHQYYHRYGLPVMQTETHAPHPDGEDWLWTTWSNIQQLRRDGVPICGMTWYSLTDQLDWDTQLREENNRVYPVGLYDLDRKLRPVGKEYKRLIQLWHQTPLVPNGPLTLIGKWDVPAQDH
jgi:beta-glucosidase/6-phospho-beta-glucosidase/beta-galactosidase